MIRLVASARVVVNAIEDGVPALRPSALCQVAMACSHSGSRPVPEVQARSGCPSSSARSVLAPEYGGARTITGARKA
jgi:hypothetical protein